ncbi:MAG: mitochondrial fission ELM1 family protein [Candidatus Omnitrophica bacterium]|nr:mitochondrial fission ELM1 family protein [Candidatus Omnitrophota bacterium]
MPEPRRQRIGSFLADRLLLAALISLRALLSPWPMSWRIRLGGLLGRIAGLLSKRRKLALNNLKRAFRDDSKLTRAWMTRTVSESYRDLGRSFMEFLMSPKIDRAYFESHVEVEGEERLAELVGKGRGAVLLTGHFGNWEFLNLMAGVRGYELAVLTRPQKLRASDAYLNRLRAQKGARIISRGMDLRRAYRILTGGGIAGVLGDQDGGPRGIFAPLFGRSSSYPRGMARFSAACSSPVLPVFCARTALDRHRIHIGEPLQPILGESEADFELRVVAAFSRSMETMIRRYPSQWMWPHRRWKSSPDRDILVLDDGRKGHLNQSLALAAKVAEQRAKETRSSRMPVGETRIRTERVVFRSPAARFAMTFWGILTRGALWGGRAGLKMALTAESYERLMTAAADTVISCGTMTEAANLIVAKDCGAKSCYIQKPQFGARRFSALLIPAHDRPSSGRNTLKTSRALSAVDSERLVRLRDRARSEAGVPPAARAAALLIGGPSKHAPWEPKVLEKYFFALRDLSREHKLYLLITTSRRTDPAVESAVERIFTGETYCPVVVIAGRSNPQGAYEGILAAADQILVTADSVSMVSEAVSTGKPAALITPGSNASKTGKFARFIEQLERDGAAFRVAETGLANFLTRAAAAEHASAFAAADAAGLAAERLAD